MEAAPAIHENHLAAETSPYLIQHKCNPVDWMPWGEEAFARAKAENKPVFLSIGYSTCHWCHVMAHESFENPEVAAVMNEYFVNIKVDREERPDVDRVYMSFVQAATGSGGWPMSVWLTPEGKPFFGGTYFPPKDRHGRPGFMTVLERIAELWATERQGLLQQGDQVIEALTESAANAPAAGDLDRKPLELGRQAFAQSYDAMHGGFGGGPKFPRPSVFNFLLRVYAGGGKGAEEARDMSLSTLRHMAAGGMHDHLGGGFHRYSVDGQWHVPHFEKMLYDQGQLVGSYLDAWQITGDAVFADVARDTLDYVARDMTNSGGGFYSAEDADSLFEEGKPEHGEGVFYIWKQSELVELLGEKDARIFGKFYGVEKDGNASAESDPHGEFTGRNILTQRLSIADVAAGLELGGDAVSESLAKSRKALFGAREKRPRPHLDDKVLTAWNGLMISAFARGGALLADEGYLGRAQRAAEFVRTQLWDGKRLYRSWREGERGKVKGFAEDYAYLIQGLLDLYEADFDPKWLEWAITLQEKQEALFADSGGGGYFGSEAGDPLVPVRTKEDYDGAEPSASSVSVMNLVRLGWMLHDESYVTRAREVLGGFARIFGSMPSAAPQMLAALDFALTPPRQIVIAGERGAADAKALAAAARKGFHPNQVWMLADGGDGQALLARKSEAISAMKPVGGKAALYLCENFSCRAPVTNPDKVR